MGIIRVYNPILYGLWSIFDESTITGGASMVDFWRIYHNYVQMGFINQQT